MTAETETPQTLEKETAPPPPESVEIMRLKSERLLAEFETPFESSAAYRHYMDIAKVFAGSIFVPEHFRNKPGECLIALNIAKRMEEDPLAVMQAMFVVGGRPSFMTAFMIARANSRAGFRSSIKWRVTKLDPPTLQASGFVMPNLRIQAFAADRFGDEINATVDSEMAIGEGWTKNPKYRTMPEHMLRYRSAAFLIRQYAPQVMAGMQTAEEVQDLAAYAPAPVQVDARPRTEALADRLAGVAPGPEPAADASAEKPPAPEPEEAAPGLLPSSGGGLMGGLAGGRPASLTGGEIAALRRLAEKSRVKIAALAQIVSEVTGTIAPSNTPEDWNIAREHLSEIESRIKLAGRE